MTTIGSLPQPNGESISINLPDEWFYKESFTLLAPDGRANVILSSEPLEASITTLEFSTIQGDLLETEFPGYEPSIDQEDFPLASGDVAMIRQFNWTPEDGSPVTQAQIYFVADGRGLTATATATAEHFVAVRETLFGILQSIFVNGARA